MGRKPTITRDKLLDLAQQIVRAEGARGLTIDALARAAGISKGGVQYSFASKEDLVRGLVARWTQAFDTAMAAQDTGTTALGFVNGYIGAMRSSDTATDAKMAGLLIAYLQDPDNLRDMRAWYEEVLARLGDKTPQARAARVAFLAVEGLFLLRIGGIDDSVRWMSLLDDIDALLRQITGT